VIVCAQCRAEFYVDRRAARTGTEALLTALSRSKHVPLRAAMIHLLSDLLDSDAAAEVSTALMDWQGTVSVPTTHMIGAVSDQSQQWSGLQLLAALWQQLDRENVSEPAGQSAEDPSKHEVNMGLEELTDDENGVVTSETAGATSAILCDDTQQTSNQQGKSCTERLVLTSPLLQWSWPHMGTASDAIDDRVCDIYA